MPTLSFMKSMKLSVCIFKMYPDYTYSLFRKIFNGAFFLELCILKRGFI